MFVLSGRVGSSLWSLSVSVSLPLSPFVKVVWHYGSFWLFGQTRRTGRGESSFRTKDSQADTVTLAEFRVERAPKRAGGTLLIAAMWLRGCSCPVAEALWLSLRGPLLFFARESGPLKPFAFLHLTQWLTEVDPARPGASSDDRRGPTGDGRSGAWCQVNVHLAGLGSGEGEEGGAELLESAWPVR